MWLDVVDLRDFYASPLGLTAQRMITQHVRHLWPDVTGQRILGIGFATPFLDAFDGEALSTAAAMPASQGVMHWPADGASRTILADEADLPIPDLSIDRVLVVHTIECTEAVRPMMREIWRVLSGSGRLLIIAPNRRGIWARFDRTPFGFGRPYTGGQLTRLLRDTMFTPVARGGALYVPPSRSRMVLSAAGAWERMGNRWFNAVGGVITVEATKQIYAATPVEGTIRRPSYAPAANR